MLYLERGGSPHGPARGSWMTTVDGDVPRVWAASTTTYTAVEGGAPHRRQRRKRTHRYTSRTATALPRLPTQAIWRNGGLAPAERRRLRRCLSALWKIPTACCAVHYTGKALGRAHWYPAPQLGRYRAPAPRSGYELIVATTTGRRKTTGARTTLWWRRNPRHTTVWRPLPVARTTGSGQR